MVDLRNRLFAHRGLWLNSGLLGNSLDALGLAIQGGYSVETDIRNSRRDVVVEHDPIPDSNAPLELNVLLEKFHAAAKPNQSIALNVKSDGLLSLLDLDSVSDLLRSINGFFFDMSVPETLRYSKAKLPFAQRLSEYEPVELTHEIDWPTPPSAYWIDGFHSDWFLNYDGEVLNRLAEKAPVIVVSSELHGRPNSNLVEWFRLSLKRTPNIAICTDVPEVYEVD